MTLTDSLFCVTSLCFQEKAERAEQAYRDKNEKNEANVELLAQNIRLFSPDQIGNRNTLHTLEGLALVLLCSSKPFVRKLAVIVLKEVRNLFVLLNVPKVGGGRGDGDTLLLNVPRVGGGVGDIAAQCAKGRGRSGRRGYIAAQCAKGRGRSGRSGTQCF